MLLLLVALLSNLYIASSFDKWKNKDIILNNKLYKDGKR